jgi:hypothetical protein
MHNKFRYLIIPDAIYTVMIGDQAVDVLGEEILEAIYLRMDDGK